MKIKKIQKNLNLKKKKKEKEDESEKSEIEDDYRDQLQKLLNINWKKDYIYSLSNKYNE